MSFRDYVNSYVFETTLGSGKKIEFRPVSTVQIKKMLTSDTDDYMKVEELVDDLLSECVVTEGFNIDDLYIQERVQLLLEVRKKTKGEEYKFHYKCPECDSTTINNVNLDELDFKTLEEREGVETVINALKDVDVKVWHITRGDQKEVFAMIDRDQKEEVIAYDMEIYSLASSIKSIITPDGEEIPTLDDAMFLINSAPTRFKTALQEWFKKNYIGLNFTFDLECLCGHKSKEVIPLTPDFLF